MQPLRRRLVAALTGLCLLLYLPAAGALTYLSAADLDLRALLPSPPAEDSAAQLADLAAVLAAQESRTAAQAELARADAQVSVFRFADVLGPAFSEEQLPLTAALFRQLGREVVAIGRVAKVHWSRPRPYRSSELVKPLLAPSSDGSYPSGHSLFGYLCALLLAQIVPERRDALLERGRLYGNNRLVAGMHYPTDVEAGRIAAVAMAALLLRNEPFRSDFEAVREEISAALAPPQARAGMRSSEAPYQADQTSVVYMYSGTNISPMIRPQKPDK